MKDSQSKNFSGGGGVKREQAGLLWRLLDSRTRRTVSAHLSLDELESLNDAYQDYRKHSPELRRRIENKTRLAARTGAPQFPALLCLLGFCILGAGMVLQLVTDPGMSINLRIQIFSPLFLGAVSPLALYFLPAYRIRFLFRFPKELPEVLYAVACFIGLLWTLTFIGRLDRSAVYHPSGWTLFFLCLGAASAPLLEEVLFRELLPSMIARPPHFFGHALSAALFSISHLPGDLETASLYVMSALFLSVLRIQTEGLLFPFLAHAAANVVVIVFRL